MQGNTPSANGYASMVLEIKENIRKSRFLAMRSANRELLLMYHRIGGILFKKLVVGKWGTGIIERISSDILQEFPGIRGFSPRNLRNMRTFFRTYFVKLDRLGKVDQSDLEFWQSLSAKLKCGNQMGRSDRDERNGIGFSIGEHDSHIFSCEEFIEVFLGIGFSQHITIMKRCHDLQERYFYMRQSFENQWSVRMLEHQIESELFERKGKILSNFQRTLPEKIQDHAMDAFKDEYLLEFLNSDKDRTEPGMEKKIISKLKDFMMSLGDEFTFVGNQYRLIVGGDEFFIDLLFYHRALRCMVAFELKTGKFKPEYAGKMNFYLSALDELVKHPDENPSIGIVLCKQKNDTVVEFAFKDMNKPMGIATFCSGRKLPKALRKYLPEPKDFDVIFHST